jgi:hypothetical protein
MARPFRSRYSQHTATFPSFEPWERRNRSNDLDPIDTEDFTVPGSDNEYSVELDHGILQPVDFTVYDATADQELQVIGYDEAPSASQVAVKYDHGLLKFHSSLGAPDEDTPGHSIQVLYTPLGTVQTASFGNQLQAEIEAVIAYVYPGSTGNGIDVRQYFIPGVPEEGTVKFAYSLVTQGMRFITRLSIFANDISTLSSTGSDVTTIYLNIPGDVIDVSLPVVGTDLQKRFNTVAFGPGDWPIDATGGPAAFWLTCPQNAGGHANITVEITLQ